MSFIINSRPSYWWPVVYFYPVDGGKFDKHTFDVEFKYLDQEEIKKALNEKDSTDVEFCKKVVLGWKGIESKPGVELPFSQDALSRILKEPGLAKKIVSTFLESVAEAAAKN